MVAFERQKTARPLLESAKGAARRLLPTSQGALTGGRRGMPTNAPDLNAASAWPADCGLQGRYAASELAGLIRAYCSPFRTSPSGKGD
jgi:hypothetical protein